MKFLAICLSFLASAALAQTMGIKDIPANGDTTIKIQKGANSSDTEYQITNGEDEIEGDPANLLKDARENWKKACADWKKETKEINKDNSIVALNCGSMKCTNEMPETTCRSVGTHKIKVRIKN
jgi:hypothetical protein